MNVGILALALTVLAATWLGPLPRLARDSFAAHMTMHMAVVAVAAPLLALAFAGRAHDPVRRWPRLFAPIVASMIELVVVWAWHTPALHQAARHDTTAFLLEQGTFLGAGVLLWAAAVSGDAAAREKRAGAGVIALLFTSMHMTLLGALFALGTRPLFTHHSGGSAAAALADQHLGGAIMLLVGGAAYLAGALWLVGRMLRPAAGAPARQEWIP